MYCEHGKRKKNAKCVELNTKLVNLNIILDIQTLRMIQCNKNVYVVIKITKKCLMKFQEKIC